MRSSYACMTNAACDSKIEDENISPREKILSSDSNWYQMRKQKNSDENQRRFKIK